MRRKLAIALLIVCALAILVIFCAIPDRYVARLPDGQSLTLVSISFGTNAQPVPDGNALKQAWRKLTYSVLGASAFNTNKQPYVRISSADTAVFWFRKDRDENAQSTISWMPVLEIRKSSPLSAIAGTIGAPQSQDIVGIIWPKCPTNKDTLLLSFYKRAAGRKAIESDLDPTNLLSQVRLINPAYRK
jgi:hypothetical protein